MLIKSYGAIFGFAVLIASGAWTASLAAENVKTGAVNHKLIVPDGARLNILIRTTLIALDQANRTGNYTVLRDLAAPSFQKNNSAAKLGYIFRTLRKRNLRLGPLVLFDPKLSRPPVIGANHLLALNGFVPTLPERIYFDMSFQRSAGDWRLFGLSVRVAPPGRASAPAKVSTAPNRKTTKPTATNSRSKTPATNVASIKREDKKGLRKSDPPAKRSRRSSKKTTATSAEKKKPSGIKETQSLNSVGKTDEVVTQAPSSDDRSASFWDVFGNLE